MKDFIRMTNRSRLAAWLALALLATMPESGMADEDVSRIEPAIVADTPAPILKEAVAQPAEKKTAVDAPPGYADAPMADGEAPSPRPSRDWSEWGEFAKTAAILDQVVNNNVRNAEKRYLPQFQRLVKVECSLLLRACDLDEKQQAKVLEVSDTCARIASRRYSMSRYGVAAVQGRIIRPVANAGASTVTEARRDPRGMTKRLVRSAVDTVLSPEQKVQYAEEDRRRDEHLKGATIMNLVILVDRHMMLTSKQREQLAESLTKNWDPSWSRMLRYLLSDTYRYIPQITEKHVVPLLTAEQKVVWQSISKTSTSSYGSYSFGNTPAIIEDEFGGQGKIKIEDPRVQVLPAPINVIRRE